MKSAALALSFLYFVFKEQHVREPLGSVELAYRSSHFRV
jgi:hypothetical protein